MATDLTQTNPEMLGIDRQRALAQALLKKGLEVPQGQMIGNRYVGAHPLQFLGNLAQQYVGQQIGEQADTDQIALAKRLRQQDIADVTYGMDLFHGKPAVAATPELVQQGPTQTGGNIPIQPAMQGIPEQPANPMAAMAHLLGAQGTRANALGIKLSDQLFKNPKWEKSEQRDAQGNIVTGFVNVNSQNPVSTFVAGSKRPDYEYLKGIDEGYIKPGAQQLGVPGGFGTAVQKVLSFEGGYTPKDGLSGSPANFGINQKYNPDVDVKSLTQDKAVQLYKTRYWDAINGDQLPPKTAEIAFDAAVNQGPDYAKKLLAQTNGDPVKMLQQRAIDYQNIVKANPAQAQFLPSWMNRLQSLSAPDNGLSPKETRRINADILKGEAETAEGNRKNAKEVFSVVNEIQQTLPKAHGSGFGNLVGGAANFFGIENTKNQADAQLKVLSSRILMTTPRFQGPQSDKDVAVYKEAAGQIGDPSLPMGTRMAALDAIKSLNQKYAPELDWASLKQANVSEKLTNGLNVSPSALDAELKRRGLK
ncbi:MAG: hypothetical protein EBU33_01255 [Sphingobacteriia bacterium]|nr:hypothetical protein [Sphingobacteriia bacterium]